MNREFRVLPWDFFASENEAPPRVEAIQISGAAKRLELLPRGGRVYFRLESEADERVWATLDDCDDTDFVRTFRRAIGSGRIGRVFEIRRLVGHSASRILLLISARGDVQMREWCATRWFGKELTSPRLRNYLSSSRLGVLHPKWSPPIREAAELLLNDLFKQPFGEAEVALTRRRWLRGNPDTLSKLVSPFIWKQPPPTASDGFHRVLHVGFVFPAEQYPSGMNDVLQKHFEVKGFNWQRQDDGSTRGRWEFFVTDPIIEVPAKPSAHERLEALLELRDWLRDKVPAQEIEAILSHVQP